jgi:hypothetical protein
VLEQARHDVGLIDAEPRRLLIPRNEGFLQMPQANAPVFCFHETTIDSMTAAYLDSFERIWDKERPDSVSR